MRWLFFIFVVGWMPIPLAKVINNWTNPFNGRWEWSNPWSLVQVPASNQVASITNAGYKAVNIDSATVLGFPDSLIVSALVVSAPTNGQSTLLLIYLGFNRPMKVLNGCGIGTNGTVANYHSWIEVDGGASRQSLLEGGRFIQEGGLTVASVNWSHLSTSS